jgi:hypothetical protein
MFSMDIIRTKRTVLYYKNGIDKKYAVKCKVMNNRF